MTQATDLQVGGSHYKSLKMQPMVFCMNNDWDAPSYLIMKYVTRYNVDGGKGAEDIAKAIHTVHLRDQLAVNTNKPATAILDIIPAEEYSRVNSLDHVQTAALNHLETWIRYGDPAARQGLIDSLQRLAN